MGVFFLLDKICVISFKLFSVIDVFCETRVPIGYFFWGGGGEDWIGHASNKWVVALLLSGPQLFSLMQVQTRENTISISTQWVTFKCKIQIRI